MSKRVRPGLVNAVVGSRIRQAVTAALVGMGLAGVGARDALGLSWNGTDPTASAVSVNGLTDNYGELTNECVITNTEAGEFGTGTYLGNGWILTALHVVSESSAYGTPVPGTSLQINIYGQIYNADEYVGWGSSDIQLVHVAGYTSGTATTLTGVERGQIYTGSSETGNLMQLGGFGVHGLLNSGTDVNNETFHRGFNLGIAGGGVVTTYAVGSSRLVQDGYLLGYQQGGDSGSGLWMDNGPDQDLDLRDWSLIGSLVNGTTPGYFGNNGQYARISSYQSLIISTVFPESWLTWNANNSTGTATDGSGTWDLSTARFTDGTTNWAFNGPMATQQVTFGTGSGAAGTVTLAATIPVDQIVFNAAGSGNYTIAGSGTNVLNLGASAVITTNVNATISAGMTGGTSTQHGAVFEVIKNGTATLTLTGPTNLSSGAYFHERAGTVVIGSGGSFTTTGGYTSVADYTGDVATLTAMGTAIFNGAGQDFNLGDLGGTGVLNVQDTASVTVGQLYVGKGSTGATGTGATGTVNQTGGTITASNFVSIATLNTASVGVYNLSGGVLLAGNVSGGLGQSTFNFNGGTLRANSSTTAFMQGLTAATVGSSAAIFDSNGHTITAAQPLNHSSSAGSIDGGLSKVGIGTLTLTAGSNYTGPTAISAGTLALSGTGSIGSSSGVTVNGSGAEFLQLSSVPLTQTITLTNGTLDGIGSVGPVQVGNASGGVVTNGNGAVGTLTLSGLTFNGVATDNVRIPGGSSFTAPGQIVTNALTTPASSHAAALNVAAYGLANGTYDLIQYGSLLGGGSSGFALGTVTSLGNHQTASLATAGSDIVLVVGGSLDEFTATDSNVWHVGTTGLNHNFKLSSTTTGIDYADGDALLFDDTASTGSVSLTSAVSPAWTTFNNSSLAYTISTSGGFGIAGTGGITKNGTATVTLTTNNTFTGAVIVNGGMLFADAPNSAASGALAGTVGITVNSGGTLMTSENGLFGYGGTQTHPITINTGGILTSNINTATTHLGALTLAGGTLAYPGVPTGDGLTYGSYNLDSGLTAGGTSTTSVISAQNIALTESGGTVFNVAPGTTANGIDLDVTGTFVHTSGSADTGLIKSGNGTMRLSATNTYTSATNVNAGILIVSTSGAITASSNILVGNISGVGAAMYQLGGTVTNTNAGGGAFQIGSATGAAGYYSLSGGTLNIAGEIDPGGSGGGVNTFGQFDMTGGTLNLPNSSGSYFLPNRGLAGETSVVNIVGGTVQVAGAGTPADNGFDGLAMNWSESGLAQTTTITIANGGQFLTPSLAVKVNNGGNGNSLNTGSFGGISGNPYNVATLNLKSGGVLQTLGFATSTNDANVTLNFNGGTLKAGTAANTAFLQNLGNVYVYGAGGTIDNNAQAITISQVISSPDSLGVSSVSASGGNGYTVPPQVNFSGGGGSGAAGYATINSSTGAVTGIVVTNPGTGYTSAPAATLTAQGGGSGAAVGTVTTAANTAGTLTFQGSGATTLSGASTYVGSVIVNAGTVNAAYDQNNDFLTVGAFGNPQAAGRTVTINNGAAVVFTVGNGLGGGGESAPPALSFIVNQGGLLETAAADVGVGGGGDANVFGNITLDGGTLTSGDGADAAFQSVILLGTVTVGGTTPSTINTNAGNTTANGLMLGTSGGVTFNVARTGTTSYDLAVTAPLVDSNAGTSGSLIKAGLGIMQLGATNPYTGTTSVNAGRLVVSSTGAITASSNILVGNTNGVGAAMYQLGGTVTNTNAGGGGFQIGSTPGASGYYSLSAGTLNIAGEIDPGGSGGGTGTFGQFDMTGGMLNLPNATGTYFLPDRGTAGESSVTNFLGGTVQIAGGGTPANIGFNGLSVGLNNVGSLTSTITISGTAQFLTPSLTVKLNDTSFGGAGNSTNISILNLDGGTLQTLGFGAAANQATVANGNAYAVLNFNGGTIKAGTAGNTTFLTGLGSVYVYSGGGTIDSNSQTVTIAQNISSPTNLGVSSVNASGGSGYVVPPQVSFSGGNGSGATAYATINASTGAVTGIVITNPGTGYTSAPTVTLTPDGGGSGATIGSVTTANNSGGSLVFQGSGITTLSGTDSYSGPTIVNAGTLYLTSAAALPKGTSLQISTGATTTLAPHGALAAPGVLQVSQLRLAGTANAWTGKLDLSNNAIDIAGGSLANVTNQIALGFSGGTWNGSSGIVSTTAAADTHHLTALGVLLNDNGSGRPLYGASGTIASTFDGVIPSDGDILAKFTYYGDANLDGKVDGSDYSRIDSSYLSQGALTGWYNGDFNYDGVVNGSDYTLIDNAFNSQGAQLTASLAAPDAIATAQIAGISDVPEPTACLLPTIAAVGLLLRRRRAIAR